MAVDMSEMPLNLRDRHWTVDDYGELPHGDGNRYEIVDGVLVVTGSPKMRHQRAVGRLLKLLDAACPPEYEVFLGPFAVVLAHDTVMQPDLLVARVADLTETELPAPPVLAVEVLSPSTWMIDLNLKSKRFARAGTPGYWVVDPAREPERARLRAWRLAGAEYEPVDDVYGDKPFTTTEPYPVAVVPAALVR
jgi:Uma2 family endonuclease